MKYAIGIDVGKTGGIAVIDKSGSIVELFRIPKIKNEVDINNLYQILNSFDPKDVHVGIEDVYSIFGSSAKSNFSFGHIKGVIEGIVIANRFRYTLINPKVWQKVAWQGVRPIKKQKKGNKRKTTDTKATSLLAASRLFPQEDFIPTKRSRKPHDGLVDAALIGEYVRRKFL